ncbi:MAG TPA: nucleoside-diphosphate sugar epimerase/dehydratase [Beijerinckiaceae bacterium]|nr:nucleoside-diphosphate sugar epimerase/dehydratase [Beijerinckiaceae bacterium]
MTSARFLSKRRVTVFLILLHDFLMSWGAVAVALFLRVGSDDYAVFSDIAVLWGAVFAAISVVVYRLLGLTKSLWQYASIPDLLRIGGGSAISILLWTALVYLIAGFDGFPRSLPVILWLVAVIMLSALRLGYRLMRERREVRRGRSGVERPTLVLVIGAGDEAGMFIRAARAVRGRLEIVGLIDHKNTRLDSRIAGVPVLGALADLGRVIDGLDRRGRKPDGVVLSVSPASLSERQIQELSQASLERGVRLFRQPSLGDLLAGKTEQMAPVPLRSLLGRAERDPRALDLAELATDRRVLVTGAGGTIGTELVRQLAALRPAALALVEQSEFNLYEIERQVRDMLPAERVFARLCDVRRADAVGRLFEEFRPELVIHAAALKHVPLIELNPSEGVLTNVLGTMNVAEASCRVDSRALVLISTDKAVNPTNVMGATKRLAEAYLRQFDLRADRGCRTRFITVRFGNVIGSSGSVIPLFQSQLEHGGPLTVTHPEVTRYFMTVGEAVSLVLRSAAYGLKRPDERGRIFVLDMGEPVRIMDLARQMIEHAGLRPDVDVKIDVVGLRPGEKLHEELFDEQEERVPTEDASFRTAIPRSFGGPELRRQIEELCRAAENGADEEVRTMLQRLVPGFRRLAEQEPEAPAAEVAAQRGAA